MRIIHILNGSVLHTTPGVIRLMKFNESKMSDDTSLEQYFCIIMFGKKMLYRNVEENPYPALFDSINHRAYGLFYSINELSRFLIKADKKDKIIYHSVPPPKAFFRITSILFLFNNPLFKRSSVIFWGGDYKIPSTSVVKRVYNRFLKCVFTSFKYVCAISLEDVKEITNALPKANVQYAPYMSVRKKELKLKQDRTNDKNVVMVSHSGWPENNHHYSFELLKRFVGHIKVVCPLCYGQKEYIQNVVNEGLDLFGADFLYFTDLKPIQEYMQFLSKVDVFVTAAEHQTSLGTIFLCMGNGSKVYIKGNLLKSLEEQSFYVFNLDQLKNLTIEEFLKPLDIEKAKANVNLYNYLKYEGNESLGVWRKLFAY